MALIPLSKSSKLRLLQVYFISEEEFSKNGIQNLFKKINSERFRKNVSEWFAECTQKDVFRNVSKRSNQKGMQIVFKKWVQYIGSERVNQKGVFRLLISERRLSSEKWLMLLIKNLNVKHKYWYGA